MMTLMRGRYYTCMPREKFRPTFQSVKVDVPVV